MDKNTLINMIQIIASKNESLKDSMKFVLLRDGSKEILNQQFVYILGTTEYNEYEIFSLKIDEVYGNNGDYQKYVPDEVGAFANIEGIRRAIIDGDNSLAISKFLSPPTSRIESTMFDETFSDECLYFEDSASFNAWYERETNES